MPIVSIIVGSTREGRFSEKVAQWLLAEIKGRKDLEARLLDLRDYPMPFFDQAVAPSIPGKAPYAHPVVQQWTAQIAEAEAYIFVSPEYNHGIPGVLKNAIDWVNPEWRRKPATFVGYGGVSGARSVEHLRLIACEMQMAPLRSAMHIPMSTLLLHLQGKDPTTALNESKQAAASMVDDLLWWSDALKAARNKPA
jgi:NAD(P)H-dependent FMN reductase